jgi:RecB family endonuclease NucS
VIESQMEDLIASYPDDFFPDRGFELKGRQESFAGVGRFDLLFEDRFKTKILMELKAVPARYEVATQLAKYKDELRSRGENHIMMWLVAPQVASSVREFLDRIGIEYSEIHEAEFRRVAERHGLVIPNEEERHGRKGSDSESNPSVGSVPTPRTLPARTAD